MFGRIYNLHCENYGPFYFWQQLAANKWEPATFECMRKYLKDDSVYLDVGAWVGPTVLYAATRCKFVYCLEPDPIAYKSLMANIVGNHIDNVVPFYGALTKRNGIFKITNSSGFGNSVSRISKNPGAVSQMPVVGVDFARLLELFELNKVDYIKIDIEGGEFDLLPSLAEFAEQHKPHIHLSLHAPNLPQAERADKISEVAEFAKMYKHCYINVNRKVKEMRKIQPGDICGDHFCNTFTEIFLTDTDSEL